ncbi:hypothetical protein FACS1894102_4130 [Spirochaetia bacterium]|nr:hypothetical protein FACS1894102_4130 [Spirochaetia bacterium]
MKRLLVTVCIINILFLISACTQKRNVQNGKITVTAAIFPPYDFVRAIAKDKVNLSMLLPPASESHSFEPTPRDIITIQNSDIFIYVGGESDEWLSRILQTTNQKRPQESLDANNSSIIKLMDIVDVEEEEIVDAAPHIESYVREMVAQVVGN